MAATAVCPELSVMNVMRAVAITATSVDIFYSFQRTTVAIVTANIDVCAHQRELRL